MFCQETTAHEVVMLGLREFGISESSRSVKVEQTDSLVEFLFLTGLLIHKHTVFV